MPWSKKAKWGLILCGSLVWSATMVKSGLVYDYGIGFWGPNGHDGVWHISLASGLSRGTLQMPIFAGENIRNYHLGFDFLLAVIFRLTSLPVSRIYFQVLPPVISILTGLAVYSLVLRWCRDKTAAWWSAFFIYFGGSWGWLVSWLRSGRLGGESMFWSQQAISTLINPPFALSVLLILIGLLSFQRKRFWPAVLVFAVTGWVKIYAGVISFSGLLIWGMFDWIRYRETFTLRVLLASGAIFSLLFFPFNQASANLLVWKPFWFLETLTGFSDRLNWPYLHQVMVNNFATGDWMKYSIAVIAAFCIFIVGNLGTRIVSIFCLIRDNHGLSLPYVFLGQGIILGILFPLLFIQTGTPWNTIQFFYYSQVFAGILAGVAVSNILKIVKFSNFLRIGIWILVIGLTLPTTYDTLHHYLPSRPPAMIPQSEILALDFLSRQPPGVVLTPVFTRSDFPPPKPLYLYESTAYVSAFGGHPVFLEDEINLDITGYDWRSARQELEDFFTTTDASAARGFLQGRNIRYLYLPDVARMHPRLGAGEMGMKTVFENTQVAVWAGN
ncbi:MAG: hypothetical protein UX91_C0006G0014 [Candidatus Amesbacteria bacterium GW2011_GWB1_47_19]|nr:MAG: hypothetical protein UW51_C0002G0014 [Candidatus Amesbacteria bacterium GW2011_GWA1_44_24]KKU31396.1 MAG: hypothetical protein UX46_C0006G0188 [Candidatus Amesbacteria bacterium GW2011_GWC1_46_24]KKU66952.1 MAG: hypothetical protein UX91_C0006G0014 [Candidatus Amesbacteria bacterium GW2011_GWB1_47_19]HBC72830.1 hypothetical protein [Candidatus Amesbacteria bacterium]